jgi:tetraacyldisaccharide-1-P 4'-kinase
LQDRSSTKQEPIMTKKDYVAIAKALAETWHGCPFERLEYSAAWNNALTRAATNIADVMQADNARFDRQRFLVACGVQS